MMSDLDHAGHRVRAMLEDLTFFADNGAGLDEAAWRLGMKADTLDRALRRHGQLELLARLRSADPRDWNRVA